jgi:hypothetical protein
MCSLENSFGDTLKAMNSPTVNVNENSNASYCTDRFVIFLTWMSFEMFTTIRTELLKELFPCEEGPIEQS